MSEDTAQDHAAEDQPGIAGRWLAVDPHNAFLAFTEPQDGRGHVSGSDGCNGVQGEYTLDGRTATIRRGFGTLRACLGVDTWLRGVQAVTVDGDTLRILDGEGEEIGALSRER